MVQSKISSFFQVLNRPKDSEELLADNATERCTSAQEDPKIPIDDDSHTKQISDEVEKESVCDFEKDRLARIERNRAIMSKLGLGDASNFLSGVDQADQKARKRRKQSRAPRLQSSVPQRRSLRHARGKPEITVQDPVEEQQCNEKENAPRNFVENSSLIKYVCEYGGEHDQCRANVDSATCFKERRMAMFDSKMVRCYSLDYWPQGDFIAGAGKNGHVSVFSCHQDDASQDDIDPLVSQKLHRGWICDVRFVGDKCPKLLTAGNDGVVALWDLSLFEETTQEIKQLGSNDAIHDGGIFSMDYQPCGNQTVLTGSKDGSVAITQVDGLKQVTSFDNVHEGHVVKCVKWRSKTNEGDANIFLSSGNDGKTRLHDIRSGSSSRVCFTASSVVNTLLWNPYDLNIFLSAGNDHLHVHDMRVNERVLASLTGHNDVGSSGIYQPIFVNQGKSILTAGSSKSSRFLTLFDLEGEIISRGDVGCSVGASLWCSERQCAFFSGPRKICIFDPCS